MFSFLLIPLSPNHYYNRIFVHLVQVPILPFFLSAFLKVSRIQLDSVHQLCIRRVLGWKEPHTFSQGQPFRALVQGCLHLPLLLHSPHFLVLTSVYIFSDLVITFFPFPLCIAFKAVPYVPRFVFVHPLKPCPFLKSVLTARLSLKAVSGSPLNPSDIYRPYR